MTAPAVTAEHAGKRFGRTRALRDCTFDIPAGAIVALVGPNGAGKSTLLQLAAGLTAPDEGRIRVFGANPHPGTPATLARTGYVAQDHPLYRRLTVAETMSMGEKLNARWDRGYCLGRLKRLGIPLQAKTGQLSGGQQAQVALVLALGKMPDLIVLDEPLASLDPLARREFLQTLLEATVDRGSTVLLSSHILADLERVCDFLLLLTNGRIALADDIERIVARHKVIAGPRTDRATLERRHRVIDVQETDRQTSALVCGTGHIVDAAWQAHDAGLETIVLGYLGNGAHAFSVQDESLVEVSA